MLDRSIKLKKVVMETKYFGGHLYWDISGSIIKQIESKYLGWKFQELNSQGMNLLNAKGNQQLLFNQDRIILIQENVENLNQFKKSSEIINFISQKIDVPEYSRIGNRYLFLKEVASVEEGEKIFAKSSFLTFNLSKIEGLGEEILNRNVILINQLGDKKIRIAVNTISIKGNPSIRLQPPEYNPQYAILLDFDIFIDKPIRMEKFTPGDFIQKAHKILDNNALRILK